MLPLVLILQLLGASAAGSDDPLPPLQTSPRSVPAFFESLGALGDAILPTAAVSDLELVRDGGRLVLHEGTLALLELEGVTIGALFSGTGSFRLQPRHPVDRAQMLRLYGAENPELVVRRAFLLFSDSTSAELSPLSFNPEPASRDLRRALENGLDFLTDDDGTVFDPEIAIEFANDLSTGIFHLHMEVSGRDPHFFRFRERSIEEVSFGREADVRGRIYEIVTSFNRAGEPLEVDPTETEEASVSVMRMEIDAEFNRSMDYRGASTAYMVINVPGGSWVPFSLYPDLELDALTWADGTDVQYTRGDESPQVWIRLPEDSQPGVLLQMSSEYHGKVGQWQGLWFYLGSTTTWYPSTPGTNAAFDITFRTPEDLPVISVGKRVSYSVEDGIATSRWLQSTPFDYASYNVGRFREWDYDHDFIPPVRLQMNERAHSGLPLRLQQRNPQDFVANDVTTSLSFFQTAMGPLGHEEFNVTEIPYLHGQAFPGMIHLSFATFGRSREESTNGLFRAHEVAHQWWGITVRWRSYRDRWLSEGMAEFSALWYLETVRGDRDEALKVLRRYRDRIVGRRNRAGPTGLGHRVAVGGENLDYQKLIYEKGAWVGHMLRHLLMDYDTADESVFRAFLTEVVNRYRNRKMSTREFQAVLEEYVQGDMAWFFDQWIYGTAIPHYKTAHRGETLPDGRYRLELRVRQENVPEDFKMIVPVLLDFGQGRTTVVRMMVSGLETLQEMVLPAEPLSITVNPFEAVLARVDSERW